MRACKVCRNAPERRPITKFATLRDRQVLQSPRASGPEKVAPLSPTDLQAQEFTARVILRGRRDVSPTQEAMEEVCSLRGLTLLGFPGPYHRGVRCPYPTICRLWVACSLRVVKSPVVFLVATPRWPPVRCAVGLDFLWGAEAREDRHLGALKVVFCPQAHAGHIGRLVVTATSLWGHWRPQAPHPQGEPCCWKTK